MVVWKFSLFFAGLIQAVCCQNNFLFLDDPSPSHRREIIYREKFESFEECQERCVSNQISPWCEGVAYDNLSKMCVTLREKTNCTCSGPSSIVYEKRVSCDYNLLRLWDCAPSSELQSSLIASSSILPRNAYASLSQLEFECRGEVCRCKRDAQIVEKTANGTYSGDFVACASKSNTWRLIASGGVYFPEAPAKAFSCARPTPLSPHRACCIPMAETTRQSHSLCGKEQRIDKWILSGGEEWTGSRPVCTKEGWSTPVNPIAVTCVDRT